MELRITLPLDNGFLRRECPHCKRQFKWHDGPIDARPSDTPEPPFYHCPYCGDPAPPDAWWTEEQLEHAEQAVAGPALRAVEDELRTATKKASTNFIKLSVQDVAVPPPPDPLVEPGDMTAVESPCHPWEPVKVADDWNGPLRCLVCGEPFSVG